MTNYTSDILAILGVAETALSINDDSTLDIGALDPQVYLNRNRIRGGSVRVLAGWVQWYTTEAYTNGRAVYADQYAVSVMVENGDIGEAITKARTLRAALNGLQYRLNGGARTLRVSNAYPMSSDDGDVDMIQFLVDSF